MCVPPLVLLAINSRRTNWFDRDWISLQCTELGQSFRKAKTRKHVVLFIQINSNINMFVSSDTFKQL